MHLWCSGHRWRSRAHTPLTPGVPEVVDLKPVGSRAAGKGAIEPAPFSLLQPSIPCIQGNRGVEATNKSLQPQRLRVLPELCFGNASVNPRALQEGQWLTFLDLIDAYFHIGFHRRRQMLPSLLSQWHSMAIHSSTIWSLNQPESIYKNT